MLFDIVSDGTRFGLLNVLGTERFGTTMANNREFRDEIVDDRMAEVLRSKSTAERLAVAFSMWRTARLMILANLQREHPDWTAEQLSSETAKRMSHGGG